MASETREEKTSTDPGSPRSGEGEAAVKDQEDQEAAKEDDVEKEEPARGGGKKGEGKVKGGRKRVEGSDKPKEETREKKARKRGLGEKEKSVERPTRERKSVERYSELTPQRASATKSVSIEQGPGIKLKDIPNVFFKLSKRKADDNIQFLHMLLFGKKAKILFVKRNIYGFSGFVWGENEEKLKAKVKEKLAKCNKDRLADICDVLDIPFWKTTTKKEELSAKLLEFLESPCITRDVVLAEKDQKGMKRKRRTKVFSETVSAAPHSDKGTKKKKSSNDVEEEDEHSSGDREEASFEEDRCDSMQESDRERSEKTKDESDEPVEPVLNKKASVKKQMKKGMKAKIVQEASSSKKGSTTKGAKNSSVNSKPVSSKELASRVSKTLKAAPDRKGSGKYTESTTSSRRKSEPEDNTGSAPPTPSKFKKGTRENKKNQNSSTGDGTGSTKQSPKSGSKLSTKERGKGKPIGKVDVGPTREELHAVVSDILREVDFNTATLADILRQLGTHFNLDLMDRKLEIKSIIEDVIKSMTDDEEDGGEGDDAEKAVEEDEGEESDKDSSDA